mgnify:CR=1 FL=1
MATPWTVVLHSGGLRSLVTTALLAAEHPRPRLALLHLTCPHAAAAHRAEHLRKQAEHFQIRKVVELALPVPPDSTGDATPAAGQSLKLVAALTQATAMGSDRVVWPAQFDADVRAAAHATELALVATQLIETELAPQHLPAPRLDTPLAELTDVQVVELGVQLDVPWALAWSCLTPTSTGEACQSCEACRRRAKAFAAAGVAEPSSKVHA